MDLSAFLLQQFVNAIFLGSIYALIALGYTMVYGIIELINFAHGELFTAGAFIGVIVLTALQQIGWVETHFVLTMIIVFGMAMAYVAVLGVAVEHVAYKPLRGSSRLAALLSALGMSIFLSNGMMLSQGVSDRAYPQVFGVDGYRNHGRQDYQRPDIHHSAGHRADGRAAAVRSPHPSGQGHAGDGPK